MVVAWWTLLRVKVIGGELSKRKTEFLCNNKRSLHLNFEWNMWSARLHCMSFDQLAPLAGLNFFSSYTMQSKEPIYRLQFRTKLLRHFGMNENLGRENHLPQQIFPPLPLINVALPPKTPWGFLSPSKQHWWRGGGEEKHFCDLVGVSIKRNGEIRSLIAFVSTSFVHDCSLLLAHTLCTITVFFQDITLKRPSGTPGRSH